MKLLCVGDLHYRASKPRSRLDDYAKTLLGKVDQINEIADQYGCDYILQPGDFFDSAVPPMWLLTEAILKHKGAGWMAVLGQHDQRYHTSDVSNTPMAVLQAAGAIYLLGAKPFAQNKTAIYGCSWGDEIPYPSDLIASDCTNILVMHRMVVDQKLWQAQEGHTYGHHLLRKYPHWDLILTGDNHHFFALSSTEKIGVKKRWLVNCGSLMRTNIDQVDHIPTVVVYDTDKGTATEVPLQVEPAAKVLDLVQAEEIKSRNEVLESFVEQIGSTSNDPGLDFLANLKQLTMAEGLPEGVVASVEHIVEMSDDNPE